MVKGRYMEGAADIGGVLDIRKKVFEEEYKVSGAGSPSFDDNMALHAVAYDDNDKIVAAGTLYFDGLTFTIDKIAVLPDYRRHSYGDFVLKILIDKAASAAPKEILGRCFTESAGFMESVGFEKTADEADGICTMRLLEEKFKGGCCSCKDCHPSS